MVFVFNQRALSVSSAVSVLLKKYFIEWQRNYFFLVIANPIS
ncbi:hypothetical protein HMPREF9144_2169 [Prevotella pallens ATCC 700821]|uniref:Uncharacterized protein n=1 Tax=Prevotella pallens ATCC 700821 TaxID=997353 RepID=F9DKH7_9BACT|nr:hypothetical protein HMPREF9144_2169 [Prevotella pallens ATCC 700821]